jgi:hypothetical protein
MTQYAVLIAIIAAPIALGIMLRVSASHLFFSVMAGELLARYFADEGELALKLMFNNPSIMQYAHVLILSLPVLLTAIVLKNSISRSRSVINIVPLIVTGIVYAAFAVPLLPVNLQNDIQSSILGRDFVDSSRALIGFVVLFQLVILWLTNRGESSKRKRK